MDQRIVETIATLERDGTLTPAQRAELERRLLAALAPADRSGRFVAIVASLGAALVAAGLLYLVGYNWDVLPKAARLALIFGLWAGVHAAGLWLGVTPGRYPRVGMAFTVLGVLCFGAAIGLVAQIYNLVSHYPNALLAWWLLNVPVLLWSRSRAVQTVVTGLFLVWSIWHFEVYAEDVRWDGIDEDAVVAGALLAGLAVLACALAESVAGTAWETFAGLWRGLAWLALIAAPFVLGFEDLWNGAARHTLFASVADLPQSTRPLHGFALALLIGSGLLVLRRWRRIELQAPALAALSIPSALLLAALTIAAPFAMPVAANLILLAVLVAMLRIGTRDRSAGLVNLAVGAFCVAIFARYVEHLWDKLEGAYAFLASGALLLALGWFLERRRRLWIARSKESSA